MKAESSRSCRAIIYALLAEALAPPEEPFLRRLTAGEWGEELRENLSRLGYPGETPTELQKPQQSPLPLKDEYWQRFARPGGEAVRLVESVYRPWTLDESAALPFRKMTGLVGGDAAAHLTWLFGRMGLSIPEEWQATPDHLVLELELMSYLAGGADRASQITFLNQHLNWLPLLLKRCEEAGIAGFYRLLLAFAAQFVAWDLESITPDQGIDKRSVPP